jgi:hypothetical protein
MEEEYDVEDNYAEISQDNGARNNGEAQRQLPYQQIDKLVCCLFWIIFIVSFSLLLTVFIWSNKHQGCGIPIYMWFSVEATLMIVKACFLLFIPYFFLNGES